MIRSDREGEYVNIEQQQWCTSKGIQQQLTPAYTPQLNGNAECLNRTLIIVCGQCCTAISRVLGRGSAGGSSHHQSQP